MSTATLEKPAAIVATGIPGFDDIVGGGLTPQRLYVIEGDPGAGKTTLALQFMLEGVRLRESVLYVTLSETRQELEGVAQSHGWSLEGIHVHDLLPSQETLMPDGHTRMFHPSEVELSDTTRGILEEIEKRKPKRVVFDSLSELRMLAQNPLRYRRQILALKQFFVGRDCTVLLLDDRTAEISDRQLHSIAHGVVSMDHLVQHYGAERRRLRVMKMRGKHFRGGWHDFIIRRGGLDVFPRLVASEHHTPFNAEPLRSGNAGLDQMLGGGLDRGTSMLIMGPAGAGKSSFAVQYAVAAAQRGEHAAVFCFDESRATLFQRTAGLGIDLKRQYDAGRVRLQQVDPAELSPGEFAHVIKRTVQTHKSRVVVIDSLNGYLNAMPEERFLQIHLHELLTYLGQQGVVTFVVMAQHGLIGSAMHSPVDASYIADSVLVLRFFEAQGKLRRAVSVLKKRSGAHEDALREYRLTSNGIWIGDPLSQFHGVLHGTPQILAAAEAR
ncbi:MAG TPA: ATPase domain-containing protein [Burkholderiales bacterium]|nr:ATPase domain-containing protein [Burkholderiales bacterium]